MKVTVTQGTRNDSRINRVFTKRVADDVYFVDIETAVKRPQFSRYCTGLHLEVQGIRIGDDSYGLYGVVELHMDASRPWGVDVVEGRYGVRVWVYDLRLDDASTEPAWEAP